MVFRKGGRLPNNLRFYLGGDEVQIVEKFSFLGVVFTPSGSFSEAQSTLAGQGSKALFQLEKYLQKFINLSPKHVYGLFDKLVCPVLSYGCEVWGFHPAVSIERLHLKFCKRLLGVKSSTQNNFIYGELGCTPLKLKRFTKIVKYWLSIVHNQKNVLVKCIYSELYTQAETSRIINWAKLVKQLLCTHGFGYVWLEQGVGDINSFLLLFQTKVRDIFYTRLAQCTC